ncbi:MAG: DUF559 domain-containing protein [Patescibacteria group bacterium]
MGTIIPYDPKLKQRASYLRNHSTRAEIMLWNELKGKKMLGYDFNRQKPILNYIVDFFCMKLRLVIEIDGESHDFKSEYDLVRQNNIENLDIVVFRFSEKEVKKDIQSVLDSIRIWIENKHPEFS